MKIIAKPRDDALQRAFSAEVSIYKADMLTTRLVLIDVMHLGSMPTAWRGSPVKSYKLLVRSEHVTALTLMSCG